MYYATAKRAVLYVRRVMKPILDIADAESVTTFDPTGLVDERQRAITLSVQRPGQSQFREAILNAYAGKCAITGCDVQAVLESAHIIPYCGVQSDHVTNGLLLRLDLHRLFDAFLLSFDPSSMTIRLNPALRGGYYGFLEGKPFRMPRNQALAPNQQAIRQHFDEFSRRSEDPYPPTGQGLVRTP